MTSKLSAEELAELVYNMKEENKKLKQENKKLKEENEKLKPLKKPSKSVDKPDWIEIEKINMANREEKLKEQKIKQDKIDMDYKPIIQDLDKHLANNKLSNNRLQMFWDNKDFKHGDLVVDENSSADTIYKLISETKTQFRVSKLECCVAQRRNSDYEKYYKAELRGYGWMSGTPGEIKWNRNWKDGKTGNITKKKLENDFFVIDKKYLTFQDSNNTVIL